MSGAILVTGAGGFVGTALLPELLATGRQVVALTRRAGTPLPPGVEERTAGSIETLDDAGWRAALDGIDTVLHLAAIAHIGPGVSEDRYDAVNHRAVAAMATAARASGLRRIVFLSSIRAQCGAMSTRTETETTPEQPTDPYGRAKLAAEQALAASGVAHVILRPVLIVGDEPKGNLALLLRLARTGLPLPFGGLSARRSMVSRADVVEALIQAIDDERMTDRRFILADAEPMTLGEAVAALRRGLGLPPRLFAVPEGVLALPFRLIGRNDLWQRIGGALVARPDGLAALGFMPRLRAAEALQALARRHAQ